MAEMCISILIHMKITESFKEKAKNLNWFKVKIDENKKNPNDFVLWKRSDEYFLILNG